VAAGIEDIRNYAESEGWSEYYVILEVAGHTDNVPNPGTGLRDGNWKLASERANTVLDYIEGYLEKDQGLKKRFNINSGQAQPKSTILRSSGYSHHLPVESLKNKTQNRRIELRLFAQPVEMLHLRTAIK
jgi:flagellar motor protein MotB